MGLNIRKKILIREKTIKTCSDCKLAFDESLNFCPQCGKSLTKKSTKIYANLGKSGITSISYKTADGITINSNGRTSIPLGKGVSYTTSTSKKK